MKWIKPKDELPPQGKKILYFEKGDCFVVQRLGEFWLPIPFYDSQFYFTHAPELWADFEMPNNLTGRIHVMQNHGIKKGQLITIDEMEKYYPKEYSEFVKLFIQPWECIQKTKENN